MGPVDIVSLYLIRSSVNRRTTAAIRYPSLIVLDETILSVNAKFLKQGNDFNTRYRVKNYLLVASPIIYSILTKEFFQERLQKCEIFL